MYKLGIITSDDEDVLNFFRKVKEVQELRQKADNIYSDIMKEQKTKYRSLKKIAEEDPSEENKNKARYALALCVTAVVGSAEDEGMALDCLYREFEEQGVTMQDVDDAVSIIIREGWVSYDDLLDDYVPEDSGFNIELITGTTHSKLWSIYEGVAKELEDIKRLKKGGQVGMPGIGDPYKPVFTKLKKVYSLVEERNIGNPNTRDMSHAAMICAMAVISKLDEGEGADLNEIKEELETWGIKPEITDRGINEARRQGRIYEKYENKYKFA